MKFKRIVLPFFVGTLALSSLHGVAQGRGGDGCDHFGGRYSAKDGHFATQRLDALKAELKLTKAQEGAWGTFANGMETTFTKHRDDMRAHDWKNMNTPEVMKQRGVIANQNHADITKIVEAFYGTLDDKQKQVFDQRFAQRFGPRW